VSCSGDRARPGVRLIDRATRAVRILPTPDPDFDLIGFSPSGRWAYAGLRGEMLRWDLSTTAGVSRSLAPGSRVGDGIALTEDVLFISDGNHQRLLHFPTGFSRELGSGRTRLKGQSTVISRDRRVLAASSLLSQTIVFDLATGERWSVSYGGAARRLAAADGHVLFVSAAYGLIVRVPPPKDGPTTPEATRAWLDSLTNQTLDSEAVLPRCSSGG